MPPDPPAERSLAEIVDQLRQISESLVRLLEVAAPRRPWPPPGTEGARRRGRARRRRQEGVPRPRRPDQPTR